MLRFLKLRLIVNGMHIYSLMQNRPIVVNLQTAPSKLVVTDGFHITAPVQVTYSPKRTYHFTIACIVEDDVLVGGSVFMLILFCMGFSSGFIILQLLSFAPIFYLLFLYYIKRKEFIQIRPA
ncbi:MAG: hypothetical protein M3Y85_03215 [Bacteroidota bacterium]|nr:hypothetical protein [Bacteroidota bacterium]